MAFLVVDYVVIGDISSFQATFGEDKKGSGGKRSTTITQRLDQLAFVEAEQLMKAVATENYSCGDQDNISSL